jgi:hypothetical protein
MSKSISFKDGDGCLLSTNIKFILKLGISKSDDITTMWENILFDW